MSVKIHLGPAGIPISSKGSSTPEGIERVAELGLDAMEVEFVRGVHMKNPLARQTGKIAKEKNIILSVHAPYYINLCNPEKVKDSKKRILDSCERAHYMGAWIVVFHPGYYSGLPKDKAFELILKSCKEMDEVLEKEGWDVRLGLETTGKVSQFGTLEENIGIHKKIKNCVPVVDWAHIFARNVGRIDFEKVIKKMESIHLPMYHTHFSNIEYTVKGERNHLTINHKKPDFMELAKELLKSKIKEITLISESPILEKDSFKMRDMLANLGYKGGGK